jgi:Uma2 family endonuclease
MYREGRGVVAMSTDHLFEPTTSQPLLGQLPVGVRSTDLSSGDEMTREEFHRLYERAPEDFKAELIGGIVYVASPLRASHGEPHLLLSAPLAAYQAKTLGVQAADNTTVILGEDCEVQPDLLLRILPEYGGQSRTNVDDYIEGPPELAIEIALSSRAIDLHAKRRQYARYGVREYLVLSAAERQLRWFDLAAGNELQPDNAGVYRIQAFPGLWINGPALLAKDYQALMKTLEEGLATPEHAAFVEELAKRRK